ncbi:MAG: hypothetical protein JNL70_11740 [Saprospiraceae bacterium]|nr:hypothetical protein [Saprospiraceae bacterium]
MATFLVIAKIASIILALRFFHVITSVKTSPHSEPNFFGFQVAQFSKSLKIFFGVILVFSIISFVPFGNIYKSLVKPKTKTLNASMSDTFDKKNLYGTWELEGYTHTVKYQKDKTIVLDYGNDKSSGAWNITQNKLLITLGKRTQEYQIEALTSDYYEIKSLTTGEIFKANKIE